MQNTVAPVLTRLQFVAIAALLTITTACDSSSNRRDVPAPTIDAFSLPTGEVSSTFPTHTFTSQQGAQPLVWTVSGGVLPNGMSLSTTGELGGTPTEVGTFNLEVTVTDNLGRSAIAQATITIDNSAPVIAATTLPAATSGTNYTTQLTASAGNPPLAWQVMNGSLPDGLSLSSDGQISGTPTTNVLTANFDVEVTDATNRTATGSLSITVTPPAIALAAVTQVDPLTDDPLANHTFRYDNLTGHLIDVVSQDVPTTSNQNPDVETQAFVFDAKRNLLERRTSENGVASDTFARVYDASDNEIARTIDFGADGIVDLRIERTFSLDNDVTEETYDTNDDGTIDRRTQTVYAIPGHPASQTIDTNGDGVTNWLFSWTYGADPTRATFLEHDQGADGVVDSSNSYSWIDNSNGTVSRIESRDENGDLLVDRIITTVLPATPAVPWFAVYQSFLSQNTDTDADGTDDAQLTFTYDTEDRLAQVSNNTASTSRVDDYVYDADGLLTEIRRTTNGTLTMQYLVTYTDFYIEPVGLELAQYSNAPFPFGE